MSFRQITLAAAAAAALAFPAVAAGEPPAALFGRWTLDAAKSVYHPGPAPFVRATRVIEQRPDGTVKITDDLVRPRGGVLHLEWIGQFDGQDYPAEGFEDYSITYAYRPVDDRTYEIVQKSDGMVVGMARMVLSADGKTITTVTAGSGSTTVYEKDEGG